MKRIVLLVGLMLAVLVSAAPEVGAAQNVRARLKQLLDANGDGVISIPERGAGRLVKAGNRQQRALGKNERVVRKIK
jgi:hypothetical protein